MPKPKKKQRPSKRHGVWLAALCLLVIAGLGLVGWQKSRIAGRSGPVAVSSAVANVPPPTAVVSSNNFDLGKFSEWLTNQTDLETVLSSGGRLLEEGRPALGVLCFRRALELKPEHEEAWFNLGVAQSRLGQLAEAEFSYRRAISNFTEYAEARNNLGNLLTRQKRYAEAAEQFHAVLEQTPDNATAHNNLGRVLAEQFNTLAALQQFAEAARLDTNYLEARFNLGAAHLTMGQTNEAVAAFRETLRLRPDFAPALNALAKLRRQP